MNYICTYFDINFLGRGLSMINSIKNTSINDSLFYILTLDNEVRNFLQELNDPAMRLIELDDIEAEFKIKNTFASKKEYFFSLTPYLCMYCLDFLKLKSILYVDADIYFTGNIEEVTRGMHHNHVVAISPHRHPWPNSIILKKHGKFNVGINFFKNHAISMSILERWITDCNPENQKDSGLSYFSDQISLDDWSKSFNGVYIIDHIGVNVAPWNAIRYSFKYKNGNYYVNNEKLICYHFSNLQRLDEHSWNGNSGKVLNRISGTKLMLYKEYAKSIQKYTPINNLNQISNSKISIFRKFLKACLNIFFNGHFKT